MKSITTSLTEPDFAQIGKLTYILGLLEFFITYRMSRTYPEAERPPIAALSKRPISQKFERLRAHPEVLNNELARRLQAEALIQAERAYEVRNHVLHGAWMNDREEGVAIVFNPGRGHQGRFIADVTNALIWADDALTLWFRSMFLEVDYGESPLPIPFIYSPTNLAPING